MHSVKTLLLTICWVLAPLIGVIWALNLPQIYGAPLVTQQVIAVVLGLGVAAGLLSNPYSERFIALDILLALAGAAAWFWYAWNFKEWMVTLAFRTPDMWIPGLVGLVLLAEALRKSMGLVIACLVWVFVAYGLFGDALPGTLKASVLAPTRTVLYLYADSNGVPGLVLRVIVTIVLPFMVFGKVLEFANGMTFFNNLALAAVGGRRGGPAKVAIVASAFFGSMSGSTVANIMSTGVFTIPLMIRTGLSRAQAAAVETVASNGGQIAPPIMGATAFIMAEMLQVPYSEIVAAAAIPALLYFLVLFMKVDAMAIKNGLVGMPKDEIPSFVGTLRDGWEVLISLGFLLYLLFGTGFNAGLSALMASGLMLVIHALKVRTRFDFRGLLNAGLSLGQQFAPLLLIGGAAGIIIGLMSSTGFAFQLSLALTHVAVEFGLFALLLLAGIVAVILGMGMPTTAVYVVLVTVVAPSMVDFGVKPIAAHMFLLYFGLMSMVTPPIAIGSIVASRLAGAGMWETGFLGMRIGVTAYILPFVWIYNPALVLEGSPAQIVLAVVTVIAAAFALKMSMVATPWKAVPQRLYALGMTAFGLIVMSAPAWFADNLLGQAISAAAIGALVFVLSRIGTGQAQARTAPTQG
jgi:TRAP transporter 4TM/12TM fusion protein